MTGLTGAEPRTGFRLVRTGPFAAIFWGKMCSAVGAWMQALVAAVVVYDATSSAAAVSVVSIGQFSPQLFLAPLVGKWADRGNKVRQIAVGHALCVVGAGGLVLVMLPDLQPAALVSAVLGCSFLTGLGFVLAGPALHAIVPELIRPGEFSVAMALNTFPNTFGRLAGPAAGAFAASVLEPEIAFATSGMLYGVIVTAALLATFPTVPAAAVDRAASSVRAALAYVRGHKGLRRMLLGTLATAVGSEPTLTLVPALGDHVGGSDAVVGWLATGFGVGALLGTIGAIVAPQGAGVRTLSTAGLVLLAVGTGSAALVPVAVWAITCFVLSGVGFALAIAGFSTLLQAHADASYRGRVTALWLIAFVGARPLTAVLVGAAADVAGLELAFAGAGVLVLGAAWLSRPSALGPKAEVR